MSYDEKKLVSEIELANLRLIFERDKAILSDEDYKRLASLVEDESEDLTIDHDFDYGPGN